MFLDHSNWSYSSTCTIKVHIMYCSISVWLSVTIFLTTLKTLSVSALTVKKICIAFSSSGEILVFGSG